MPPFILAIDQGTTSSRAVIFSADAKLVSQHQIEFKQYFPENGWVEHDPEEIWQSVLSCCNEAIKKAALSPTQIKALGISNQRETTILWNKKTGVPIYPAIVWQDRRTADFCQTLISNHGKEITEKTGLLLDPYFSATKIKWILDNVKNARKAAEKDELAFGTIDTFLLWRLTEGKSHATDITNASRTLLFNIHTQQWDEDLLNLFEIPKKILPEVLDNDAHFGITKLLGDGEIPITGMVGDQQAALIGQACFEPGMIKSTYGTGCFVLLNTGKEIVHSKNQLLTTVAYRLNKNLAYGLEGSIFIAGAAIQWLRDALHFFTKSSETEILASQIKNNAGVYFVPAFTGLGAPYWDPHARGGIFGLTRDTQMSHIVRAALEAVCYQTRDLLNAIHQDYRNKINTLRVDGGMVANNWLLQFLADILNISVDRPAIIETSVLGAAFAAGLGAGIYSSLEEIAHLNLIQKTFIPEMETSERERLYEGWKQAIKRVGSFWQLS